MNTITKIAVIVGLALVVVAVLFLVTPPSHQVEFEKANGLIHDGNSQSTFLQYYSGDAADISSVTTHAATAKNDYIQAMNVLNEIPERDLNKQDLADIQAEKIIIGIDIERCDLTSGTETNMIKQVQIQPVNKTEIKNDLQIIVNKNARWLGELNNINTTDLSSPYPFVISNFRSTIQADLDGWQNYNTQWQSAQAGDQ